MSISTLIVANLVNAFLFRCLRWCEFRSNPSDLSLYSAIYVFVPGRLCGLIWSHLRRTWASLIWFWIAFLISDTRCMKHANNKPQIANGYVRVSIRISFAAVWVVSTIRLICFCLLLPRSLSLNLPVSTLSPSIPFWWVSRHISMCMYVYSYFYI